MDTEDGTLYYDECFQSKLITVICSCIDCQLTTIPTTLSKNEKKNVKDMMRCVEHTIAQQIHNEEIRLADDGRLTVEVLEYNVKDLFNGRYLKLFKLYSKEAYDVIAQFQKGIWDKSNYEYIVFYHILISLALDR